MNFVRRWRMHLLRLGIALLYLGVLLSGMSLPFAVAFPVGLAALLLYTVMLRPAAQWGASAAAFVLTTAVLAALAALIVAAGAGLATFLPVPPAWLGPAASLAGIAASRAVWSARKTTELDDLLDTAIRELGDLADQIAKDAGPPEWPQRPDELGDEDRQALQIADEFLDALPDDPPEAPPRPGHAARMDAILDPLEHPERWLVALNHFAEADTDVRRTEAAALLALRPYVIGLGFGSPVLEAPVRRGLLCPAPRIAQSAALQAIRALDVEPEFWRFLPVADELEAHAQALRPAAPEAAGTLDRLAARVRELTRDEPA